jgi:hypothetical protein
MAIGEAIRAYEVLRDCLIWLGLMLQATLVFFELSRLRLIFLIIFRSLRIHNLILVRVVLHRFARNLINHHFQAKIL